MELAGYGSKEAPVVDDQELGSEGVNLARIERVYKCVPSSPNLFSRHWLTCLQEN